MKSFVCFFRDRAGASKSEELPFFTPLVSRVLRKVRSGDKTHCENTTLLSRLPKPVPRSSLRPSSWYPRPTEAWPCLCKVTENWPRRGDGDNPDENGLQFSMVPFGSGGSLLVSESLTFSQRRRWQKKKELNKGDNNHLICISFSSFAPHTR